MLGMIIARMNQVTAEKTVDFNQLIQQLGSESYQTREIAQKELIGIGTKLINEYRQLKAGKDDKGTQKELTKLRAEIEKIVQVLHGNQNTDPEIKIRINRICQALSFLTQPRIVFLVTRDSKTEIYVMGADGKNQEVLTNNQARIHNLALNSDGNKLAFILTQDSNPPAETSITRDANGQVTYTSKTKKDKQKIIDDIYVMDADGKNQKNITNNPNGTSISRFVWSPDGAKIAFTKAQVITDTLGSNVITRYSDNDLYVIDTDGKSQKRLTENKAFALGRYPVWSPDSTKIIFISYQDKHYGLWVIDADGKNQKELVEAEEARTLIWKPDGSKIVFELAQKVKPNYLICIMDPNGKNRKELAEGYHSAWSPDGNKIAFISSSDHKVYIMDAEGKNQMRLTDFTAEQLAWSPNNNRIAFTSVPASISDEIEKQGLLMEPPSELYVIYLAEKNMVRLYEVTGLNDSGVGYFVWNPDGSKIALKSGSDIWVMDTNGKGRMNLTKGMTYNIEEFKWYATSLEELTNLFRD